MNYYIAKAMCMIAINNGTIKQIHIMGARFYKLSRFVILLIFMVYIINIYLGKNHYNMKPRDGGVRESYNRTEPDNQLGIMSIQN